MLRHKFLFQSSSFQITGTFNDTLIEVFIEVNGNLKFDQNFELW